MFVQVVAHTPLWVWGLLTLFIALGLAQSVARKVSLRRVIWLPLAMTALSLHGTLSVLQADQWIWVLWLGAAVATMAWFASSDLPAGVGFEPSTRTFSLPGSWEPLVLMMGIFMTRYAVAVVLALHPALTHDVASAAIASSLYGAMSGVFIGRMVRLLRATQAKPATPAPARVAWG